MGEPVNKPSPYPKASVQSPSKQLPKSALKTTTTNNRAQKADTNTWDSTRRTSGPAPASTSASAPTSTAAPTTAPATKQEPSSTYQQPGPGFNHQVAAYPGGWSHNTLPASNPPFGYQPPAYQQTPAFGPQVQASSFSCQPSPCAVLPSTYYHYTVSTNSEMTGSSYITPNTQPGAQNFTEQPVPSIANGPMEHQWHPRFEEPFPQSAPFQPMPMVGLPVFAGPVPFQQVIHCQLLSHSVQARLCSACSTVYPSSLHVAAIHCLLSFSSSLIVDWCASRTTHPNHQVFLFLFLHLIWRR